MRKIGDYYEQLACDYLINQGLTLVERNSHSRLGEIDLIMRDETSWIFVEVRYRRSAQFGDALMTVTPPKQRRIIATAALWLERQGLNIEEVACRFDIVAFTADEETWIENAFGLDASE